MRISDWSSDVCSSDLLDESVPVRDFRRIVEALAGAAHRTQDPAELTELIRPALGGLIVQRLCGLKDQLKIIMLDSELEQLLVPSVRSDPSGSYLQHPALSHRILTPLGEAASPDRKSKRLNHSH